MRLKWLVNDDAVDVDVDVDDVDRGWKKSK